MSSIISAEAFSKKTAALKSLNKLLDKINKQGSAKVHLTSTGIIIPIEKNDPIYLKFCTLQAQMTEELNSYAIVKQEILKRKMRPVLQNR